MVCNLKWVSTSLGFWTGGPLCGDGNPEAAAAKYWGDGEEHPSGLPFAALGASFPVASLPGMGPSMTRMGWADHVVLACCMCAAVGVS